MRRPSGRKLLFVGLGAAILVSGAFAFGNARGPHHGHRGLENDPAGLQGHGGPFARWRTVNKEDFDATTRERFARLDRNSDNVVDTAEVEAALSERRRGAMARWREARGNTAPKGGTNPGEDRAMRGLRRLDADKDGKVTREEAMAAIRRLFASADLDGDGRITDVDLPPNMRGRNLIAESDTRGEGRRGRGGPGGGPGGGWGFGPFQALAGADQNRDNIITLDEALAHAGRLFDRMDRTKDGVLDTADRDAARKEMTDYRVKRFLHYFGAKDGKITREQFVAKATERFAELDINADGRLNRDDRASGGARRWRGDGDDRGSPPAAPRPEPKN